MDVARRLKFGLAALVALVASGFFVAPALADPAPDPQHTNIPYLAWRGEEVRLVKCDPDIFAGLDQAQQAQIRANVQAQGAQFLFTFVDFLLVDWSGDPLVVRPQLEPGTVSMFFRSFDGAPCVAGTFVSQKAGMAQIKLVVTFNLSKALGFPIDGVPEIITLKHDFNVAWMDIASASLRLAVGDTTEVAGARNQFSVLVTGRIPLLSNYGELGLGDHVIMPTDWARLAEVMATSRDPLDGNPADFWDIHDEFSPTSGPDGALGHLHGGQSPGACTPRTTAFYDTVDNCLGGGEFDGFSRVWLGLTNPTVGPFDPQRPDETLLSNGILDEGDAPMPSALINVSIDPNTPGGINGVGHLYVADKHVVYSRNGQGTSSAHNLYGPFYGTWLPATVPTLLGQPEASGVAGPFNFSREDCGRGNNFPGFLNNCFYHYWDFVRILRTVTASPTGCKPLVAEGTAPNFGGAFTPPGLVTATGTGLPQGVGPQHVDVYTDEHGEARVNHAAGLGFFFLNIPGVAINANGGCDIANIPGGILGTSTVRAEAKYPFEPVTARSVPSNELTKTIISRFEKSITCFPKGALPEEQNAAICVARALDITGKPFVGETVCFMADFNAEDIQHFTGNIPLAPPEWTPVGNAGRNFAAEAQGLRRICPFTDERGLAAVEIFNTNPTRVDVQALFVDEGILRHIFVQFPITGQVGPATGVNPSSTSTSTPPVTTPPTSNPPTSNNPPTSKNTKPVVQRYKIAKVKLVKRLSKTKARVQVRVNGPAGKATIRLRIKGGNKAMAKLVKVKTNKLVTLTMRTPATKTLRVSASLVT